MLISSGNPLHAVRLGPSKRLSAVQMRFTPLVESHGERLGLLVVNSSNTA